MLIRHMPQLDQGALLQIPSPSRTKVYGPEGTKGAELRLSDSETTSAQRTVSKIPAIAGRGCDKAGYSSSRLTLRLQECK